MSFRTNATAVNGLISGSVGTVTQGHSAKLDTLAALSSVSNLSSLAGLTLGNSQFLQTDGSGSLESVNASTTRTNLGLGSSALLAAVSTSGGATDSGKTIALNGSGQIDSSFIPPIALVTVTTASGTINWATQSSNLQTGDVLVITDQNQTYMRNNGSAGTQADFTQLLMPTSTDLSAATGVLSSAKGGTGNDLSNDTTYPINGVMFKQAAGAYKSTAAGSQYQVLSPNGSGVPTWGALNLSQAAAVTGLLGVATGGTGAATAVANVVFAGPNGSGGAPAFRSLVSADIPALAYVTTVGLSLPGMFTVSGSPVTAAGTLTAVLASQAANLMFASPDGSSGLPAFRSMTATDVPSLDASKIGSGILVVAHGGTGAATAVANVVFAGPDGSGGAPAFRALAATDIPALSAAKITSGQIALAQGGTGADLSTGTQTKGVIFRSSSSAMAMVADPTTTGQFLGFNGTTLTWSVPSATPTMPTGSGNLVLATPSDGSNGTSALRALVASDIPNLAASKITSGQVAIAQGGTGAATAAQNTVFAAPISSTGAPSFRMLDQADIPNLTKSFITDLDLSLAQQVNVFSTASQTLSSSHHVCLFTYTATNAVTCTLPAVASAAAGKMYIIKDAGGNAATHNLTIQAQSGENIDGANTHVINQNYEAVTIVLGNGKWNVI